MLHGLRPRAGRDLARADGGGRRLRAHQGAVGERPDEGRRPAGQRRARRRAKPSIVFRQLDVAVTRFLDRRVRSYGFIAQDAAVREAVCLQQSRRLRTPPVAGQPVLSRAGFAGCRAQAPRRFGAAPAAVSTTRWRFGRFGGSAMRMSAPAGRERPEQPGDRPRRPRQGHGAPPRPAPAGAGRDERADLRSASSA